MFGLRETKWPGLGRLRNQARRSKLSSTLRQPKQGQFPSFLKGMEWKHQR